VVVAKKGRAQRAAVAAPAAPDRWLGYATLPLRYFLGATFVYAGLQKIADPGFLQPGSGTYIGTQLQAFAIQSPIGFLINAFALSTPQLTGLAVIATELVVGALVIAGLATRWAAAVGAAVNFVFFLTASWSVQPYFLGSDSIYTVAWITLALVGDQGVFTARPLLFGTAGAKPAAVDLDRRRLLVQLGSAAAAAVWVLAVLPHTRRITAEAPAASSSSPSASVSASPSSVASPAGTRVGAVSELQSQGFLNFQNPANGDPAVAVSLAGGQVVAFDAVCTHAGCTVEYDTGQKLLSCPCHGALFDPAHGAAVVAGPAPTPLPAITVEVSDGGVYAR
jgi:thiosulfate dehydrogenase (quinone) large subunit